MEENRILDIQEKVKRLLDKSRLKKAIDTLDEGIDELQDWDLRTKFTGMQTAYGYLLDYMAKGIPDPDRERLHSEMLAQCYMLNDMIAIARLTEHSTKVYCQMRRRYKNLEGLPGLQERFKENAANLQVTKGLPSGECKSIRSELASERTRMLSQLFGTILGSIAWSKSDTEGVCAFISDNEIPVNDRAVAVSALMLSTLKCFEPAKVTALCTIATNSDTLLSTRAIVGLVIVLYQYSERIRLYSEIGQALETLAEDGTTLRRIQTIQIQLLRCRETQKIDRKMREEIIPAMMKNPNLSKEKFSIDILKEIEEDEDKNPEWKQWLEKDEIKGKIEEMAKWQVEGADVYMSTFSQLKRFPFFNEFFNWFRPFDVDEPSVAEVLPDDSSINKTIIGAICNSPIFCNSDKYSFCFTFKQIPQEQRDMLMGQITGAGDPAEQMPDTFTEIPTEKRAEVESNQYIQDLYRFFKISNYRHEFSDPFAMSLNLLEKKELAPLADSSEAVLRMFRYLVEKEYYSEAINAGKIYEKSGEGDAQFYQEIGYCMQKEHDYTAAIDYYTKADIIKPDTLWTLRHIAQCYRLQGEFDKALSYYRMAEELAPENVSLLLQTGESFATMEQYEEAFARFFKAEYIKPGSRRAMRAIAWCSFITGKDDQARAYYQRLMELPHPAFEDYLNAAHVEWVTHNNQQAVEYYNRAKELCGNADKVAEHILNDKEVMFERGVTETELQLLIDLIS